MVRNIHNACVLKIAAKHKLKTSNSMSAHDLKKIVEIPASMAQHVKVISACIFYDTKLRCGT